MNKNKNVIHNQKHLTLSDRTFIQQELLQKSTFSSIGKALHKDPTTIAKEVKRYSKVVPAKFSYKCNLCVNYSDCDVRCKELKCPKRSNYQYDNTLCKRCYKQAIYHCPYFIPFTCNDINKPPYVCNYCNKKCPLDKRYYDAAYAQKQYEKTLSKSRVGI